jgi:hypothetical protein
MWDIIRGEFLDLSCNDPDRRLRQVAISAEGQAGHELVVMVFRSVMPSMGIVRCVEGLPETVFEFFHSLSFHDNLSFW